MCRFNLVRGSWLFEGKLAVLWLRKIWNKEHFFSAFSGLFEVSMGVVYFLAMVFLSPPPPLTLGFLKLEIYLERGSTQDEL